MCKENQVFKNLNLGFIFYTPIEFKNIKKIVFVNLLLRMCKYQIILQLGTVLVQVREDKNVM